MTRGGREGVQRCWEDLANDSEVLHTERRAGKGESSFSPNAIYYRQLI